MKLRKVYIITSLFIFFLLISIAILFTYEVTRVLPKGSMMGDLSIQGLNRSEAEKIINDEINRYRKMKIKIIGDDDQEISFTPIDLGIDFDEKQTLRKIFDNSSWFVRIFSREKIKKGNIHKPVIHIAKKHLRKVILEYLSLLETDFTNAHLKWKEGEWIISPSEKGAKLVEGEIGRIAKKLKDDLVPLKEEIIIKANYKKISAKRDLADLQGMLLAINETISKPILINYRKEKFEIHLFESPEWLIFDEEKKTFRLNEEHTKKRIKQLASEFDGKSGAVLITGTKEQISEYDHKTYKKAVYDGNFSKGWKSDQEKWLKDLEKIFNDVKAERNINISWETVHPTITSKVEDYDFPQVISTGISSFRLGNHPNRIKNIKLSLEAFNGVIIEPGEEFSFNRATGWITQRKGYTMTKIINKGKVEKGIGGGVCQSSTTVYRAILNAGLPTTERRNHSLDISYYHSYGYGLDATVYTDSRSDLKFINDFTEPLLMYTSTDDDLYEAYVDFYGKTDDRVVKLTNIPTGNFLFKKWEWKIIWPEKEEVRYVISRYHIPKKEEEKQNPLEL